MLCLPVTGAGYLENIVFNHKNFSTTSSMLHVHVTLTMHSLYTDYTSVLYDQCTEYKINSEIQMTVHDSSVF